MDLSDFFAAILVTVVLAVPLFRIFHRAGLNPALALVGLIPLVGLIIALAILAFSDWPNEPDGYR